MNAADCWAKRTLDDGSWVRADFAGLGIVVANVDEEWRVALLDDACPDLANSGVVADLPDGLEFERWDNDPRDRSLAFRPAYPPMPVVARPRSVLHLSPHGSAMFYVGIPAWIEVMAECQGKMIPLTSFPTEELSKTWHGTHLVGQLGYALKTHARRRFDPGCWPAHDIVCALNIINDGHTMMPLDRLYLQTDHLSVFASGGRLWSNAARFRIGANDAASSDVTYGPRPAKPCEDAVEITEPRKGRVRRSTMSAVVSRMLGNFNLLQE